MFMAINGPDAPIGKPKVMTIRAAKALVKSKHRYACSRKISIYKNLYVVESYMWGDRLCDPQPSQNEAWRQAGIRMEALSATCIGN